MAITSLFIVLVLQLARAVDISECLSKSEVTYGAEVGTEFDEIE